MTADVWMETMTEDVVQALTSKDKPTFINFRTVVGIGTRAASHANAHRAAFGVEDLTNIKRIFGRVGAFCDL